MLAPGPDESAPMPSYISEYSYYGYANTEFVEVALPEGTDASGYSIVLYQGNGTIVESWSLGSVQSTTSGHDVFVIDNGTPGFSSMNGSGEIWADDAIALVDDNGKVLQFLSHEGYKITAKEGPAAGMTSTNAGSVKSMGDSLQTSDRGASYESKSPTTKGTIACYAPGTLIDTVNGPCPVERLTRQDAVITPDGPMRVAWVWSGQEALEAAREDQKPVQIKAGALGHGVPQRDLVVSCQHRMLLGGRGAFGLGFKDEVLVPAKALTGLAGIRFMKGKREIRWHHFALARHNVVRANGAWSDSLLLGRVVWDGLTPDERRDVARRFPRPADGGALNGPAARPCLSVRATKEMLLEALEAC